MIERIQLVFCNHSIGHLSKAPEVVPQPPLGILTLASFIRQMVPEVSVEVIDGKFYTDDQLLRILDAEFVGFSCWFSNYDHSIGMAQRLKALRPSTIIVMGGPHPTAIADRLLANNEFVDYVVRGEGEVPLRDMLLRRPPEEIKGLIYRRGDKLFGLDVEAKTWERVDLDLLPKLDLDLLQPPYRWRAHPDSPSMSGFPLSGIRGCYRTKRCEYCSIPVLGYRTMSARKYWAQVRELNRSYGVNYFLETGDTFPRSFLLRLAEEGSPPEAWFRFFVYPGIFSDSDHAALRKIHVKTVFMGVESVLHWSRHFNRKYPAKYTVSTLLHEIERYGESGIDVITGILLGLPGEDHRTLADNVSLIRRIAHSPNVHEMVVNAALPLGDVTDSSFLLQRFRLGLTLRPADWAVVYLQGQDTRQIGANRPNVPFAFASEGDDPFDLRQAFFELGNTKESPFSLKLGRQELSYGDERLIGPAGWNNFSRTFDAIKLHYSDASGKLWVDGFVAHVVNIAGYGPHENDGLYFNDADWNDTLVGLYLSTTVLKCQTTDFYLLFRDKESSSPVYTAVTDSLTNRAMPYDIPQRVWTSGFRFKSIPAHTGNWDYDAEAAYQFGHSSGQQGATFPGPSMIDHEAFAVHAGIGHTWPKLPWTPRLGVEYNLASGDKNPNDAKDESFLNLFPSNHRPYGHMDLFSWKNVHNLASGVRVTPFQDARIPSHKLQLELDGHAFWLCSSEDAWYRANGVARVRSLDAASRNAGRFVGTEFDVTVSYGTPWRGVKVEAGYSHFFAGDYIRNTANAAAGTGDDDADFAYVQMTFTF